MEGSRGNRSMFSGADVIAGRATGAHSSMFDMLELALGVLCRDTEGSLRLALFSLASASGASVELVDKDTDPPVLLLGAASSFSSLKSAFSLRRPCFLVTMCVFKWLSEP